MIRVTSSRRRYRMSRRVYQAQRWLAVLLPFAVAVYVLATTIFDWITPIGALFSPGTDIVITGDYGAAVRALDAAHIEHRWGQDTPDGVILKVSDERKALAVLRREGISAY